MIRAFVKDLLLYLPSQIVPAIVGLIAIPIITRLFSPEEYGNYILVMATVSVVVIIVGWLPASIIRFYPTCKRDGKIRELYGAVALWFFITVALLVIIYVGVLLAVHAYKGIQLYYLMLIGVLIFVLRAVFLVSSSFFRAKRQVGLFASSISGYYVASFALGIALVVYFGYGVEGLLWGHVLSLVVMVPLLLKVVLVKFSWGGGSSSKLTKEIARYGFPLILGALAAWVLTFSDRYIIELFRGTYEVGIYSASYLVSERSIYLFSYLFVLASGPLAMNIWAKGGEAQSREFVTRVTRYYLIICLPAVIGLSVLSKPIIMIFTSSEYHQGFHIVYLIAFGVFFLGLQNGFYTGLVFYKRTNLITMNVMAAVLLNVVLNFLLVPRYGYMAAAVTTLVSYAFLLTTMIIVSRRYFVWEFPVKSLVRVTIASAIMGAVVYLFSRSLSFSPLVNLTVNVPLGVGVYLSVLLLLGEMQASEKQVLKELYQRYVSKGSL